MDWEQAEYAVELQIEYWKAVGKHNWTEALEVCLAEAQRSRTMQDVALDLQQGLNQAENTRRRKRMYDGTVFPLQKIQLLAREIAQGTGNHYFDFATGDVFADRECPKEDRGEGRPALHAGKRYIRILAGDDCCKSVNEQLNAQLTEKVEAAEQSRAAIDPEEAVQRWLDALAELVGPPQTQEEEVLRRQKVRTVVAEHPTEEEYNLLWALIEAAVDDPWEAMARRWIESLKPPCRIALIDDDGDAIFEYDPEAGRFTEPDRPKNVYFDEGEE
jgi:hypothetical protein